MATVAERIDLSPNQFAFYFETKDGVEADALAKFLKQASAVAKRQGGELRIVGLREGSLAVIIEAIKKSKVGKAAAKEFTDKPIDTTIKTSTFVGAIVWGIIHAMSPDAGDKKLSKAGADVVEKQPVTQITIVTNEGSTVVMDKEIAKRVRETERADQRLLPAPSETVERLSYPVTKMVADARQGSLLGEALLVDGELHFRPDGYRYLVPVYERVSHAAGQMVPGARFRVAGQIETLGGLPDRMVVDSATQVLN